MMWQMRVRRRLEAMLFLCAVTGLGLSADVARAAEDLDIAHEVGRIRTGDLSETSGLAVSRQNPNVLWVHNDGARKLAFAVSTTGQLAARVRVRKKIVDVEDIAIGPGPNDGVDYVYLGDIGDNDESRREIQIVRFPEPALPADEVDIKADDVEVFELRYPDGPHDAEALMVDSRTGDVFVVTKEDGRSRLYRAAANALIDDSSVKLELIAHLNVDQVSAGDMSPAGDLIILRSEDRGWIWTRRGDESLASSLERAPRRVIVRGRGQGENGEAVGFSPDGRSFYTVSEGEHEPIHVFPVPPGLTAGEG